MEVAAQHAWPCGRRCFSVNVVGATPQALNAGIPPCAVCVIAKMYHDACGPAHGWLPYVAPSFGVMALFSGQLFMLAYDGQRGQWAMRLGGGAQQPGPGVANAQLLVSQ